MRYTTFAVLSLATQTYAACECGYATTTNSTSGEQTVFTDSLQTDFTRTEDVTWDSSPGPDWRVQAYNVSSAAARGPFGKSAEIQNVVWNSLPAGSTGGQGVNGGDPGLQLWVRSQTVTDADSNLVPIAEVVSTREDFLYGSFRAGVKTTAVNGTCAAFFFYHNDSQEIDMEVLSKQTQDGNSSINFVNQSPDSVMNGFNAANTNGLEVYGLTFNPSSVYAEYRFDWLPDRIDFYTDDVLAWTMTEDIPSSPGAIHLIHWSNGDPGWSAGPPEEDAVLTVSYVNAYFNSSMNSTQTTGPCVESSQAADATCPISNDSGSPSQPNVPNPTNTAPAPSATSSASTHHSGTSGLHSGSKSLIWSAVLLVGLPSVLRL